MNVPWELAVPARAELGERPFWDAAVGCLAWVDIPARHLHRYRPGPRAAIQAGQQARQHVDLGSLHFFDPDTGDSLRD